jgi:hypothetical protein
MRCKAERMRWRLRWLIRGRSRRRSEPNRLRSAVTFSSAWLHTPAAGFSRRSADGAKSSSSASGQGIERDHAHLPARKLRKYGFNELHVASARDVGTGLEDIEVIHESPADGDLEVFRGLAAAAPGIRKLRIGALHGVAEDEHDPGAGAVLPEPPHRQRRIHHGDALRGDRLPARRTAEVELPGPLVALRELIVVREVDKLALRMRENAGVLREVGLQRGRTRLRSTDDHQVDRPRRGGRVRVIGLHVSGMI